MTIKKRTEKEFAIDQATAYDTLNDADLSSAEIVYPRKSKKVPLNIQIENEAIQICQ